MSAQPGQPADDGRPAREEDRPFTGGIGSMVAPAAGEETAPPTRPTFTARPEEPATVVPEPAAPESAPPPEPPPAPVADGARPAGPVTPDSRGGPLPASPELDGPLLSDAAALRARWQRVQADFVDDPRNAVGDAADLIEQTAQALVGALRQRQRQLRVLWEHGPVDGAADGAGLAEGTGAAEGRGPADGDSAGGADTEHLRLMMQRYRSLFNELCRP